MMDDFVYFIESPTNNLVKIGVTDDPDHRFKTIRTMSPVPINLRGVIIGNKETESKLHARFAHLRSHGEWFRLDAELTAFIASESMPWTPERRKQYRWLDDKKAKQERHFIGDSDLFQLEAAATALGIYARRVEVLIKELSIPFNVDKEGYVFFSRDGFRRLRDHVESRPAPRGYVKFRGGHQDSPTNGEG